jgi:hypothetical protein
LTSAQIVTATVAAYAAIVSTFSLILAVKVHRAANPKVDVHWRYSESDRKLVVSIHNTGRADVTITTVDLYIAREVITRRSRISIDPISQIPNKLWQRERKALTFPVRLDSYSMFSIRANNDAISLPSEYPLDELLLKFVARFPAKIATFPPWFPPWLVPWVPRVARSPGGKTVVYLRGDVLRHFAGIDPDRPIALPSPGSLPSDE